MSAPRVRATPLPAPRRAGRAARAASRRRVRHTRRAAVPGAPQRPLDWGAVAAARTKPLRAAWPRLRELPSLADVSVLCRQLRRCAAGLLALCAVIALAALPSALAQPTPVVVTVSTTPNPIGSTVSPQYIGVNHGARVRARRQKVDEG